MPSRSCAPRTPDTCWRGATLSTTIVFFVLVGQSLLNFPARADAASFVTMHRQSTGTPEPVCGESGGGGLSTDQLTYSVIVVANHDRVSTLLDDPARVCAYNEGAVYVQQAPLYIYEYFDFTAAEGDGGVGASPFGVRHVTGADRNVTVVDLVNNRLRKELSLSPPVVSHLKAACEDSNVRTVLLTTDETCLYNPLSDFLPESCWSNIVRHYPFNPASRWSESRTPYIPIGPRNTFQFVPPEARPLAADRPVFFNLQLGDVGTAPRRDRLIDIARQYELNHAELQLHVMGPTISGDEFRNLLLDSTFTICPGGHNPESHRMFEALESGSIPIVSRQDFLYPSYQAPFPCGKGEASWNTVAGSPFAMAVSVASWEQLPEVLDRMQSESPEMIQQLQEDSIAWYEALMKRSYASMLNFGEGYDLWPQYGPISLSGFPTPPERPGYTPPYNVSEYEPGTGGG